MRKLNRLLIFGAILSVLSFGASEGTLGQEVHSSSTFSVSAGANGSTGIDHSANQPTLPVVGANFGNSGIYANYVLVQTIPARSGRFNIDVQNQSSAQVLALRDDGTAASGAAPVNATLIVLGAGAGAGAQGGDWSSSTFYGRLQIYAPSYTAQIAVSED